MNVIDGNTIPRKRFGSFWPGWIAPVEASVIVLLAIFHFLSFSLPSSVNGYEPIEQFPQEVFDQDSPWIIYALVEGQRFKFNPQHHLLYHLATEGTYRKLIRPFVNHGPETVYTFLKLFAVLSGTAFFLLLIRIFHELGLAFRPRILLLLLTGVSVSAWFNFAAIESHSIGLFGIGIYVLALLRIVQRRKFDRTEQILLGFALVFVVLCRLDLIRFFLATAFLLPLPYFREHWRRISATIVAAAIVTAVAYPALASLYFQRSIVESAGLIIDRRDRADLSESLGTVKNLTPGNVVLMIQSTFISSVIMPSGDSRFKKPIEGVTAHPLSMIAAAAYLLALIKAGSNTWKTGRRSRVFATALLINWAVGILLYTWFNPQEPFIWLLEFLALLSVLLANGFREDSSGHSAILFVVLVLVLMNNVTFFYLPFG